MNVISEPLSDIGVDEFCAAVSEVLKVRAGTNCDIEALNARFASHAASAPKDLNKEAIAILTFVYETIGDDVLLSLAREARDQDVEAWFRNRGLALELSRRMFVCSRSRLMNKRVESLGGENRFNSTDHVLNDLTLVQAAALLVRLETERWMIERQRKSDGLDAQPFAGFWIKRTYLSTGADEDESPMLKLEYPIKEGGTAWALWPAYGPSGQH